MRSLTASYQRFEKGGPMSATEKWLQAREKGYKGTLSSYNKRSQTASSNIGKFNQKRKRETHFSKLDNLQGKRKEVYGRNLDADMAKRQNYRKQMDDVDRKITQSQADFDKNRMVKANEELNKKLKVERTAKAKQEFAKKTSAEFDANRKLKAEQEFSKMNEASRINGAKDRLDRNPLGIGRSKYFGNEKAKDVASKLAYEQAGYPSPTELEMRERSRNTLRQEEMKSVKSKKSIPTQKAVEKKIRSLESVPKREAVSTGNRADDAFAKAQDYVNKRKESSRPQWVEEQKKATADFEAKNKQIDDLAKEQRKTQAIEKGKQISKAKFDATPEGQRLAEAKAKLERSKPVPRKLSDTSESAKIVRENSAPKVAELNRRLDVQRNKGLGKAFSRGTDALIGDAKRGFNKANSTGIGRGLVGAATAYGGSKLGDYAEERITGKPGTGVGSALGGLAGSFAPEMIGKAIGSTLPKLGRWGKIAAAVGTIGGGIALDKGEGIVKNLLNLNSAGVGNETVPNAKTKAALNEAVKQATGKPLKKADTYTEKPFADSFAKAGKTSDGQDVYQKNGSYYRKTSDGKIHPLASSSVADFKATNAKSNGGSGSTNSGSGGGSGSSAKRTLAGATNTPSSTGNNSDLNRLKVNEISGVGNAVMNLNEQSKSAFSLKGRDVTGLNDTLNKSVSSVEKPVTERKGLGIDMLPVAMNAINGLRKLPQIQNPVLQSEVGVNETRLDGQRDMLTGELRQVSNQTRGMGNAQKSATLGALYGKYIDGNNQISQQEQGINNQQRNQVMGINAGIRAQNNQAINRNLDDQLERSVTGQQLRFEGLNSMADIIMAQKQEQANRESTEKSLRLMNSMVDTPVLKTVKKRSGLAVGNARMGGYISKYQVNKSYN